MTLDDDVVTALRQVERERGVSFKEALNTAVRAGLRTNDAAGGRPYTVRPFRGTVQPGVDLRTANRLLADLEDEELLRKVELSK